MAQIQLSQQQKKLLELSVIPPYSAGQIAYAPMSVTLLDVTSDLARSRVLTKVALPY